MCNLSILFCINALFPNAELVEAHTYTVIPYGNHECLPSNTLHIFLSYKSEFQIKNLKT